MNPIFGFTYRRFDLLAILLLIVLFLLIVFAWPAPASGANPAQAVTPTATLNAPGPTAIPPEYLESADQTNGILFGSVILVLIIVGGTLGILRSKNGRSR